MSRARPLGPNERIDHYARRNGWKGNDLRDQPLMTKRQYRRFWHKFQHYMRASRASHR